MFKIHQLFDFQSHVNVFCQQLVCFLLLISKKLIFLALCLFLNQIFKKITQWRGSLLLFSVIFGLGNIPLMQAGDVRVISRKTRENAISRLENLFVWDKDKVGLVIQGMGDPFFFSDTTGDVRYVDPGASILKYSDEVALKMIIKTLKPQGLMMKDDQKILVFKDGNLAPGDQFEAYIQGVTYGVTLESVTFESFTLRLNDVLLTQPFRVIDSEHLRFNTP